MISEKQVKVKISETNASMKVHGCLKGQKN